MQTRHEGWNRIDEFTNQHNDFAKQWIHYFDRLLSIIFTFHPSATLALGVLEAFISHRVCFQVASNTCFNSGGHHSRVLCNIFFNTFSYTMFPLCVYIVLHSLSCRRTELYRRTIKGFILTLLKLRLTVTSRSEQAKFLI